MASQARTEVVNVKVGHIRPNGYENLECWMADAKNNIYIGRHGRVFITDKNAGKSTGCSSASVDKRASKARVFPYPGSKWQNPFSVKEHGRETTILMYEDYIKGKLCSEPDKFNLEELRGKQLGCWCKPESCHGDVLVRLLESTSKKDGTASVATRSRLLSSSIKSTEKKHKRAKTAL
mmetsp:Transcript_81728/g.128686  ORF Transcript_81728/g.128686 Transcript_81728/m.128686 type:complete len:178 (-) Transcript_81728:177-710(-)